MPKKPPKNPLTPTAAEEISVPLTAVSTPLLSPTPGRYATTTPIVSGPLQLHPQREVPPPEKGGMRKEFSMGGGKRVSTSQPSSLSLVARKVIP